MVSKKQRRQRATQKNEVAIREAELVEHPAMRAFGKLIAVVTTPVKQVAAEVVKKAFQGQCTDKDIYTLDCATRGNDIAKELTADMVEEMIKSNLITEYECLNDPKNESSSSMLLTRDMKEKNRKPGGAQAQEQKHTKGGAQALEPTSTLGVDLGGMSRMPKPRSSKGMNELVWADSMVDARSQVVVEYDVNGDLELYYHEMCKVGQKLMAQEVHRRCQAIYDYRAGKLLYRSNRKKN